MYQFLTSGGTKFNVGTAKSLHLKDNYNINTIINVNESNVVRSIPTNFAGLGFDWSSMMRFIDFSKSTPKILQLLMNLGSSVLRTGSDGKAWVPDETITTWPPANMSKAALDEVYNVLNTVGWDLTWLLNLRSNNPTLYSDEANYIYTKFGSKLQGMEIGNEPDRYVENLVRTSDYTFDTYLTEWESYVSAIRALNASNPISGPVCGILQGWTELFSQTAHSNVQWHNIHLYPLTREGTGYAVASIENLLCKYTMAKSKADIQTIYSWFEQTGIPLVMGEANCVAASGKSGISDVFAAALWGIDYLFTGLECNLRRISFHGSFTITDTYYAPIRYDGTTGPLYYSMLLFHYAAGDGNLVSNTVDTFINVVSYSVVGLDGKLRTVIINKDLEHDAHVVVGTGNTYSSAKVLYLSAPSIDSYSGYTFGGSGVSEVDNTWAPTSEPALTISSKSVSLDVPKGSAAVVVFA